MIKQITTDELRAMSDSEGLILQGCGGDPQEWLDGINEMLTDEGILKNRDTFKDVSSFERERLSTEEKQALSKIFFLLLSI